MVDRIKINDQLSVGNIHPDKADLETLAKEGFKAIVNLRAHDEPKQPLDPDAEGERVRALGMKYLHYPVTSDTINVEVVDAFREQIGDLPRPVFAHCKSGMRSGAFIMMHVAAEAGMRGDETLEKAKEMGFECDSVELEQFVKSYVEEHRKVA